MGGESGAGLEDYEAQGQDQGDDKNAFHAGIVAC